MASSGNNTTSTQAPAADPDFKINKPIYPNQKMLKRNKQTNNAGTNSFEAMA